MAIKQRKRGRKKKLDASQRSRLLRVYQDEPSISMSDLATEFGCALSTIYTTLNELKGAAPTTGNDPETAPAEPEACKPMILHTTPDQPQEAAS